MADGAAVLEIPSGEIETSPYQPREIFGQDELEELAASIREVGLIQPIVVKRMDEGRYQLVVGERRLRACRMAGLERIPAVIKEYSERQAALAALTENLQRQDLHFFEEARGYQTLLEQFQLTQDELAARIGRNQSTISNKIRLLALGQAVQEAVMKHGLNERQARALLRLPSEEEQIQVIKEIAADELSARETDRLIESMLSGGRHAKKAQQRIIRVIRDMRIFVNSFKETVKAMRQSGLSVEMMEEEDQEGVVITIRVKA